MRDIIVPGGVTRDIDAAGEAIIRATLDHIRQRFPGLVETYDNTASLQDRTVDTGVLKPALANNMPPEAISAVLPADPSMRAGRCLSAI
jgi:Ni,Fe-hydrogenase III large subunit